MKNETKIALSIIITTIVIGLGFVMFQKLATKEKSANIDLETQTQKEGEKTKELLDQVDWGSFDKQDAKGQQSAFLSADKKEILIDSKELLLAIDNNTIFDWFKTESGLCDEYNLTSMPDRKMFCENREIFREKTKFSSIVLSPNSMEIGFTIESETLTPDTVAGIFSRSTNKVELLTNYYLGNEFISFSPSGTNFVYKGEYWEAMCGLFIKDSKTFAEKASINNPEYLDARGEDTESMRWVSDNEIEYRLKSINSDDEKIERKSF